MASTVPMATIPITTATCTGTNTSVVWQIWTSSNTTGSASIYTEPVWQIWNGSTQTAATLPPLTNAQSTTNTVWLSWINPATGEQYAQPLIPVSVPEPTAEELAAIEHAREEQRLQAEAHRKLRAEQEAARKAAQKRAMELLRSHLRPEQLETIEKNGWFVVEGGKSKKQYRIKVNTYAGNIFELKDDREVASYCVHAAGSIPLGDHLLAQAISLRFDEDHIIKRANRRDLAA